MAAPRTRPTPIGETLREYLGRSGLSGLSVSAELAGRWPELVGPGIASHSMPQEIRGGRLTVVVDSSAWMNQLSLLSTGIIEKLNKGLGGETVKELRFRTGKVTAAGTHRKKPGAAKAAPPRRKLTPGEAADVESAASAIADPELRASARKLLTAAASTRKKA